MNPVAASPRWLVPAALLCSLAFLGKAPVIDEESYLWLGSHVTFARPYDWHRVWQPWGDTGPTSFVYAHPPLFLWWMAAVRALSADPRIARLLCVLPFVSLYAWAVGRWAARATHHSSLVGALWLSCATVQLGLQDSLMIDLPAVALVTAGLALYHEGLEVRAGLWRGGVLLGLALATKYSMGMVVALVLVHVAVETARGRVTVGALLALLATALGIPLLVEAGVAAVYGRPHIVEVWTHRHDIGAGPLDLRMLGVLTRLALLPLPVLLLLARPGLTLVGSTVGLVAALTVRPTGIDGGAFVGLLACCMLGGIVIARSGATVFTPEHRRRKGDHDDGLLLGGVVLCVVVGVALAHNYASARYLLPAAAPLAILLARSAEDTPGGRALAWAGVVASAAVSLALSVADYRFGAAGLEVADAAAARVERQAPPAKRFAGEWSFRYQMEQRGWTRYRPGEALPVGTLVVVAENGSPGEYPRAQWEPVDRVESADRFPLRVMAPGDGVSLYAETLGALPIGVGHGPMEAATVYRVGRTSGGPE